MLKTLPMVKAHFNKELQGIDKDGKAIIAVLERYQPFDSISEMLNDIANERKLVIGHINYRKGNNNTWELVATYYRNDRERERNQREWSKERNDRPYF